MREDQNAYPVHVLGAFQELLHVQFDLARSKLHALVLQQTCKIMVHVREHHVHRQG